jgi:hypothetical protein
VLPIAKLAGAVGWIKLGRLKVGRTRVVGNLKVVLTRERDEAELVLRRAVVDQRGEAAKAIVRVMVDTANRWR